MWWFVILLSSAALLVQGQELDANPSAEPLNLEQLGAAEQRISEQIRMILEHYKQKDPVGLPGKHIPDPLPVPDMSRSMGMGTKMDMKDLNVYGLSRFRVDHVELDVAKMQLYAAVRIERMHIEGRYTVRYFLSRSQGIFNITLEDVYTQGMAKMNVARNGKLQVENIDMDISFANMNMYLENAQLSTFVRNIITSMAPFIFEGVKPFILKEVNQNIRSDINKQVAKVPHTLPNSITPLDYLVSDARRLVQYMGYDPLQVPDYNYTTGITTVRLTHVWLTGLGTFHRVGDISVGFENHVMNAGLHVGTQRLGGRCHWEINFGGYISKSGAAQFSVDYAQLHARFSQPLDTRQHPTLDTFEFKLGDFNVRVDGTGSLDYVIELIANLLPNLLRYQIMTLIETKVKMGVQEALDKVNMEEVIEEQLQMLEKTYEE